MAWRSPTLARAMRNRDFVLMWSSTTVSTLGTATTSVALPLVALVTLHASTFAVGVVSAATYAAWVLFGLTAGVWVDRMRRRPLLVVCDIARALALLSIPVAAWAGVLTLAHVILVAFAISVGSVFFDIGFQSYIPSVVDEEQLLAANSQLQGSEQAARVGGPALGGALVQVVGAPVTLLADMVSYLFSGTCLLVIGRGKEPEPAPVAPEGGLLAQVREGLGFVWRHPVLRPLALCAASLNMWAIGFITVSMVFLVRNVHVSPGLVGVLVAADGLGGVLGATVVGALSRRFGDARALLISAFAGPLLTLLVPMTFGGPGLVLFALGTTGFAMFVVSFSVVARVYRQTVSPPHLLGRVTAVNRFLSWGVVPIGTLIAGALGGAIGNRATLWVVAGALVVGSPLPLLLSPVRVTRELSAQPTAEAAPAQPTFEPAVETAIETVADTEAYVTADPGPVPGLAEQRAVVGVDAPGTPNDGAREPVGSEEH